MITSKRSISIAFDYFVGLLRVKKLNGRRSRFFNSVRANNQLLNPVWQNQTEGIAGVGGEFAGTESTHLIWIYRDGNIRQQGNIKWAISSPFNGHLGMVIKFQLEGGVPLRFTQSIPLTWRICFTFWIIITTIVNLLKKRSRICWIEGITKCIRVHK